MMKGLDAVLKPKAAFRLFADKLGPGSLCYVRAKGIESTSALVLLKPPLYDKQKRSSTLHERPPHIIVVMDSNPVDGLPTVPPNNKLSIVHTYGGALTNFGKRDEESAQKILNVVRRRAGLDALSAATFWESARSIFSRLHFPRPRLGYRFKTATDPLVRP